MKRLLVTGSRGWTDEEMVLKALLLAWRDLGKPTDMVLVHGACPKGLDSIAERLWKAGGYPTEAHPADWDRQGKAAGPIRNQKMVDLGADLCLAFPMENSKGTWNCMRLARAAGIEVRVFEESP